MKKPKVKLLGKDGNAFSILGLCQRAARKDNWPQEKIDKFLEEAKAGDYNHLLQTAEKYFDIE